MIFIEYDSTGKILTSTHGSEDNYQRVVATGALTLVVPNMVDIFNNKVDVTVNPPVVVPIPKAVVVAPPSVQVPPPLPTTVELIARLAKMQQKILAQGITVNVAAEGETAVNILCDGTASTQSGLGLLCTFGLAFPTGTKVWEDNNGVFTTLTGTQLVSLTTQVGNWITDTYAAKPAFIEEITAGTITTYAQITALVWPTT